MEVTLVEAEHSVLCGFHYNGVRYSGVRLQSRVHKHTAFLVHGPSQTAKMSRYPGRWNTAGNTKLVWPIFCHWGAKHAFFAAFPHSISTLVDLLIIKGIRGNHVIPIIYCCTSVVDTPSLIARHFSAKPWVRATRCLITFRAC